MCPHQNLFLFIEMNRKECLNDSTNNFTFISKNKKYQCNVNGAISSNIIKELRDKDPNIYYYEYDFDDQNNEFQLICDYFNFKELTITIKNMNSLNQIANDLQITNISDSINDFISFYDDIFHKSDVISEIFDQLYHIDELSIEAVKDYIIKSIWIQSYDNILELAAFILQVARTSYNLQFYLIELLILLNNSSDETNHLNQLLPFIIKQIMSSFFKSPYLCSFAYKMIKKEIISIDRMIDETYFLYNNLKKEYLNNIILWFFPELLEIEEFVKDKILNCIIFDLNQKVYDIVNLSTENNIENFKKMRDSGVPDDKIAQAIIEDDVNALQTFISQNNINVISSYICFYLYDFDDDITLINYAAKNGSIKC